MSLWCNFGRGRGSDFCNQMWQERVGQFLPKSPDITYGWPQTYICVCVCVCVYIYMYVYIYIYIKIKRQQQMIMLQHWGATDTQDWEHVAPRPRVRFRNMTGHTHTLGQWRITFLYTEYNKTNDLSEYKMEGYLAVPPYDTVILATVDQPDLLLFFLCSSAVVDYHCVVIASTLHLLHNKDQWISTVPAKNI
jgi:hypothetical protein